MKPRLNRFAERAVPFAIMIGVVACSPLTGSAPDFDVRPVSTASSPEMSADQGYYSSAVDAIKKRDYGLALNFLQAARNTDPNSPRVLNAFGVVYDKLGRFDLSTRYYTQAKAADPQSPIVAKNVAYSQVLQRLLNGDVTPTQLAAAGPAPKPPVVIETQTVSAPSLASAATPATMPPQAAQKMADAMPLPADASIAAQPADASDLNAEAGGRPLDRPILEAKIEAPSGAPEILIGAVPYVQAEDAPQVHPFAVTARNEPPGDFQFPPQSLQPRDVAAQMPSASELKLPSQVALQLMPQAPSVEIPHDQAIVLSTPAMPAAAVIQPREDVPQLANIELAADLPAVYQVQKLTVSQLVQSNEIVPNLLPRTTAFASLNTQPVSASLNPTNAIVPVEAPKPRQPAAVHADATQPVQGHVYRVALAMPVVTHGVAVKHTPATPAPLSAGRAFFVRPVHAVSTTVAKPANSKPVFLTHHPLVIVNASAQKDADSSIRRALIRHNWTVAHSRVVILHKEPYTTLFYDRADYAVARALARTLSLPMHLIPDACHCVGLRLVIGTNALNRRYSELEYTSPLHAMSTADVNLDVGSLGMQR